MCVCVCDIYESGGVRRSVNESMSDSGRAQERTDSVQVRKKEKKNM